MNFIPIDTQALYDEPLQPRPEVVWNSAMLFHAFLSRPPKQNVDLHVASTSRVMRQGNVAKKCIPIRR